jgi:Transposase IS116/IS110/IS902 family
MPDRRLAPPTLNLLTGLDEHRVVLRLLDDRDHQMTADRTRTICRVHALLCLLVEGGTGRSLTVTKANELVGCVRVEGSVTAEWVTTVQELIGVVEALDTARAENRRRITLEVVRCATSITRIHGIGPRTAAIIIGHVGDVRRFPTAGHFARHNGTAPIQASSGPRSRHRLNPRWRPSAQPSDPHGAVTQVAHGVDVVVVGVSSTTCRTRIPRNRTSQVAVRCAGREGGRDWGSRRDLRASSEVSKAKATPNDAESRRRHVLTKEAIASGPSCSSVRRRNLDQSWGHGSGGTGTPVCSAHPATTPHRGPPREPW